NSNVRVIVQYAQPPASASLLNIPLLGGLLNQVLGILNAIVSIIPASTLPTLANDPNVLYISPDRPLTPLLDYSAQAVNAGAAGHANRTGSGVTVAIIDSGIDASPDLALLGLLPRVVYSQDFVGGKGADQYGH